MKKLSQKWKRRLEVLGEAVSLDLLWALVRYLGIFGAGVAVAAVVATSSSAPRRVAVPSGLSWETPTQKLLVRYAKRYGPGSGIVYVWGGSGPFGFDCSGYVQFVYRKVGIRIPRDSRSQWTSLAGRDIGRRVKPGDAVYFHGSTSGPNAGPPPGHVGLYIGDGRYIEYYSSGRPAHVALLRYAGDFMGGKRFWHPFTVQKRSSRLIFWFARYFHVKVAFARRRSVAFGSWRGHGRMSSRRYWRIVRWAHHNHHAVYGNRHMVHLRF